MIIFTIANTIGKQCISMCTICGAFTLFLLHALIALLRAPIRIKRLFEQMNTIGVGSFSIIILTGGATGAILALQSYNGFKRFGAEEFIGTIVALSLTRELGPVLTALMVTGRAGSAMAAELGTMQITEQIDALKTLRIDIQHYLIIPRILGSVIILPFLTVFSMIFGIVGGYFISTFVLGVNGEVYITGIKTYLELSDITGGLIKSAFFGLILGWVGCFKGFYTYGGAKGVGASTTESVVVSSILILISDYFLTAFLF